jgi:hypothetical protein
MLLRLLPDEYQRRTASQTGVSELTDAVVDETITDTANARAEMATLTLTQL